MGGTEHTHKNLSNDRLPLAKCNKGVGPKLAWPRSRSRAKRQPSLGQSAHFLLVALLPTHTQRDTHIDGGKTKSSQTKIWFCATVGGGWQQQLARLTDLGPRLPPQFAYETWRCRSWRRAGGSLRSPNRKKRSRHKKNNQNKPKNSNRTEPKFRRTGANQNRRGKMCGIKKQQQQQKLQKKKRNNQFCLPKKPNKWSRGRSSSSSGSRK